MPESSAANRLRGFVQRRRSLRDEYQHILRVQMEAAYLVEELRRRRDGERPNEDIELHYLHAAIEEVDPSACI
jgi:hypothetical protein